MKIHILLKFCEIIFERVVAL